MRYIRFFMLLFVSSASTNVLSQSTAQELAFINYLVTKKNYEEAIYVLKGLQSNAYVNPNQRDSIQFLLGNIYYAQQKLDSSSFYFDQVTQKLARLYDEANFFSAFNKAYLRKYDLSRKQLLGYTSNDTLQRSLVQFELSGLALLQRNLSTYDSLQKLMDNSHYVVAGQVSNFTRYRNEITERPNKSPFLAGLLSAIIPGSGKIYAGNRGQGIYTLLISAILGMQAWEGYQKAGPQSFRFIAYTTLFTSLYIGTIWGSVFSVKLKKSQFNESIDNQILFDMHIPLRTVFH